MRRELCTRSMWLAASPSALANTLHKSETEIRAALDELFHLGVCTAADDVIEIADRFWPYQRDANAGVPLGRQRFEAETGIKQSDWYGRFWARWSDAIRDAGFAPNQLQTAYAKAELLAKYAELAREAGRIPSEGNSEY